ncbi:hypothetical protein HOY80DRAFT_1138645 [Tuber brumale]|nr:hypothetical protein HOY80DRAFT_1138645 [Tuber brumale]
MSTKSIFGEYSDGAIRVSLADIAEKTINILASTKNQNIRVIKDLTKTEINWDKERRLASIYGDRKSAIKAYDDLMGYIRTFTDAIVDAVDYTPKVSSTIYDPELARGLCFCLRKPDRGPKTSLTCNPPDAGEKGEKTGDGLRTFQLYPAHLSAQEKIISRTISSSLRSSQISVGGMRGFLVDDIATILDKYREKLPSSDSVYIKAEVTLGKNFFLEQDIKNYNLATLKLDIHDFCSMHLENGIKRVFQPQWMGEWVGKLEANLSVLGYEMLGTPQTAMEICLQEERSNGQLYNTVWLASLIPKGEQEVQMLRFLESRIQLRSCYKADILNGGGKLDMIFESTIHKNEHQSACKDISRLVSSKIRYSPRWGLILEKGAKEEYFHSAGIFFKRHRKQTKTKWIRNSIIVTLTEEVGEDGKTFCAVKVSSKHLEDLLNNRFRAAPFSDILNAVAEYLNACDKIASRFQLLGGVSDRNLVRESCSFQGHEINKRYQPEVSSKNASTERSKLTVQALRRCQTVDGSREGMACDIESDFETSDSATDTTNDTVKLDLAGSHMPPVDFPPVLHRAGLGEFCDIMGARDIALLDYPALLPDINGGGKTATTSPRIVNAPTRPASDSSRMGFHHWFGEASLADNPAPHTTLINNGAESGASSGKLRGPSGIKEVGMEDSFNGSGAESLFENKPMFVSMESGGDGELVTSREAIITKDGVTAILPAVEGPGGPILEFVNSKGPSGVQEGRGLTGTTHSQLTKSLHSQPEYTGVAGYLKAILSGGRFGSLTDAAAANQDGQRGHLSTGHGVKSAQGNAKSTSIPNHSDKPSATRTFNQHSGCSSLDFGIPMSLGEELCELEEEINALNEATGVV